MEKNSNKDQREYRSFDLSAAQGSGSDDQKYQVHGHAATFDPYTLFEMDGIKYQERIEPNAFASCDMSDVVFRIDHRGPVYARTSAGTLKVTVDSTGLNFKADLSKTVNSRGIAEDIAAGNYPQASFAFVVEADHYEPETHTRVIDAFQKIYDVSPVTFPANPATDVASARDYFTAQEDAIRAAAKEREQKKQRILLSLKLD